ncbi:hypothetical protein BOTBODRAFT_48402 [Botryobasidium botryosum FD-172 SS1]|uniref:Uncharacterized protein n=1 Tax=Botryobasidium botryosum (strain FD-172 SS1) TaxID=930990 RepID=A0A067M0C2_BOTB1|nr:hypothetical protein BOTBODRAFT_48402 [Botryobasidium botryosum FD-172 SS1]
MLRQARWDTTEDIDIAWPSESYYPPRQPAAGMDRTIFWEGKAYEPIKVNQRALIDKVLARYSADCAVSQLDIQYFESCYKYAPNLIGPLSPDEGSQNADDASAEYAKIHFKTKKYMARNKLKEFSGQEEQGPPDTNLQCTVQNDGTGFRKSDWDRLKSIGITRSICPPFHKTNQSLHLLADGNPDQQKIGAFGVDLLEYLLGFYSVFSVTDEPVVTSVDPDEPKSDAKRHSMAFHWFEDQLFVCLDKLALPSSKSPSGKYWTKIKMALRKPDALPSHPAVIARFLSTSLTFMTHLRDVSVYFDGHCLARITKEIEDEMELGLPTGLQSVSPGGVMAITGIKSAGVSIKASVTPSLCTIDTGEPSALPSQDLVKSIRLIVFGASIKVGAGSRMTEELKRVMKKPPPAHCVYQMLYLGKTEYDGHSNEGAMATDIFQGLRTDLDSTTGSARIFIGHATDQTIGIGGHVSGRFIPTVERALIELMAETHYETVVSRWNKELLFVGGYLARAVYEYLISNIKTDWEAPPETSSAKIGHAKLQQEFVHILRFFTFRPSAPSPIASDLTEEAFFSCAQPNSFPVVSTVGVKDIHKVRLYDPRFAGFVKKLPTLPVHVTEAMTVSLRKRKLIQEITDEDVIQELKSRPLTQEELIECLKWWISSNAGPSDSRDHSLRDQLLSTVKFTTSSSNGKGEQIHATGTVIHLASIRTYMDLRNGIPLDVPLPSHTFPAAVGQSLDLSFLGPALGWSVLNVAEWVQNLTSKPTLDSSPAESNLTTCKVFAARVLGVIAQVWDSPPVVGQHREIVNKLKEVTCIPTQCGMKRPNETYLTEVGLFPDLPVASLPEGMAPRASMDRMLTALGVHQDVEVQLVLDRIARMVATEDSSNFQLVKWLVHRKDTLTSAHLKEAAMFLKKESSGEGLRPFPKAAPTLQNSKRFTATQLYEPTEVLKQLDLPILDWDSDKKWQSDSGEAKLLFELGLNERPTIHDLLQRAAYSPPALSKAAFRYFLDHFSAFYASVYDAVKFSEIPFVPSISIIGPDECPCLAKPSEVFIDHDYLIMGFLVINPSLRGLRACDALGLKERPLIEVIITQLSSQPPNDHETANRIFSYLDKRTKEFTPAQFNLLRAAKIIPVRNHPESSVEETTCLKAVHECYIGRPRAAFHSKLFIFLSDFDGAAKAFLRACRIGEEPTVTEIVQKIMSGPQEFYELAELQHIALRWMKVDLDLREDMKKSPMFPAIRVVEAASPHTIPLLRPEEIVVIDDAHAYGLFSNHLYSAPQDKTIEELYLSLGSPHLSSLVYEKPEFQGKMLEDQVAKTTRALILERLPLFFHEYHSVQEPMVSVDWLSQERNFLVRVVGNLQLVKMLDWPSQNLKLEKKSEVSAVAFREKKAGSIQLLLAHSVTLDMYEYVLYSPKTSGLCFLTGTGDNHRHRIAHSMCKVLFHQQPANDTLLGRILSGDLEALKRRGAADYSATNSSKSRVPPPGVFAKWSLKRSLGPFWKPKQSHSKVSDGSSSLTSRLNSTISHSQMMHFINASIDAALKCEGSHVPLSSALSSQPPHISITQEPMDGVVYCDTNNRYEGFMPSDEINGYRIHVERGTRDSTQLMVEKKDCLDRFTTQVINPLHKIYDLPKNQVHVVYTDDIRLMAFNHDHGIFLNLHYYEICHDEKVAGGAPNTARISWYLTFAHEIAHNVVEEHNANHEYLFSHICERFLPSFISLITQPEGTQAGVNAEG